MMHGQQNIEKKGKINVLDLNLAELELFSEKGMKRQRFILK